MAEFSDFSVQVTFPQYKPEWKEANDEEKRWRIIIAYKYFSLNKSQICKLYECARSHVQKVLKKYHENAEFIGDSRSLNPGRPCKLQKKRNNRFKRIIGEK